MKIVLAKQNEIKINNRVKKIKFLYYLVNNVLTPHFVHFVFKNKIKQNRIKINYS